MNTNSPYRVIKDDLSSRIISNSNKPLIIGISGAQGSGKSYIARKIQNFYGDDCAVLGLDDFYLTKTERQALAQSVCPLFETRGPPGTHHVTLMIEVIHSLQKNETIYPIEYPKFDKLSDDRAATANIIKKPPKLIIIEGWCLGAKVNDSFISAPPLNLAETKDKDHSWRKHQYTQLQSDYNRLWTMIDQFYYLVTPSFETVSKWKMEQLANDKGLTINDLSQMDKDWVQGFIQYYERITRAIMDGERIEGVTIPLADNRSIRA